MLPSELVASVAEELREFEPGYQDSQAGLRLLLRFGMLRTTRAPALARAGGAMGVVPFPALACCLEPRPADSPAPLARVLGFARIEPAAIREGVRRLRGVLRKEAGPG